jgi:hypothetical protein
LGARGCVIGHEELSQAVIDSDARASEGVPFAAMVESVGVNPDALLHLAEQRALRLILILRHAEGGDFERLRKALKDGQVNEVSFQLSIREKALLHHLTAIYGDAFMTAMLVSRNAA